jgi:hypothetical protein
VCKAQTGRMTMMKSNLCLQIYIHITQIIEKRSLRDIQVEIDEPEKTTGPSGVKSSM